VEAKHRLDGEHPALPRVGVYLFGHFRLDVASRQLLGGGHPIPLTAKVFDTLVALVSSSGRVVGKEELMGMVWHDTTVSDDSLTQNIKTLRRALGDHATEPEFIATVARHGYRFVAPVTESHATDARLPAPHAEEQKAPDSMTAGTGGGERSDTASLTSAAPSPRSPGTWAQPSLRWLLLIAALSCAIGIYVVGGLLPAGFQAVTTASFRPLHFTLDAPEGTVLRSTGVLSPNGRYVALLARDSRSGSDGIWLRDLETGDTRALAASDGASRPFWSPDSAYLGFFSSGSLRTVDLRGGSPRAIARVRTGEGGSWGATGDVLIADFRSPLSLVPASGGKTRPVTELDTSRKEVAHRWPQFLPDGRHFLYFAESAVPEYSGTFVSVVDANLKRRLVNEPAFYASGNLLYVRNGTLLAQRFDSYRLRLSETQSVIAGHVASPASTRVSAAEEYLLAYSTDIRNDWLVWFDRSGRQIGRSDGPPGSYNPALSFSEKHLLIADSGQYSRPRGVWLLDLESGAYTRITDGMRPYPSPDGTRLVFTSDRDTGIGDLYFRAVAGQSHDEVLLRSSENKVVNDWSTDGRYIVYSSIGRTEKADLWVLQMDGNHPRPLLQSPYNEVHAQISPDGRWVAYASDESGRWEVYVQSFPLTGFKRTISVSGGTEPRWRRDGREIFYLSLTSELMAVNVRTGELPEFGRPVRLFGVPIARSQNPYLAHYAVAADGERFLVHSYASDGMPVSTTVLVNWEALLHGDGNASQTGIGAARSAWSRR
jgi:DNA-binding winged helix-turn-helix (wHTH) protein/Tol biopolymer transport system component